MEDYIEFGIKCSVKQIITEKVQEEIDKKVEQFRIELEARKDNYIAEIMKGIRMCHEQGMNNEINYKIIFENIYSKEGAMKL